MKVLRHICTVLAIFALFFVIPALCSVDAGALRTLLDPDTDAVSSASVIMTDKPSGEFTVILNTDLLSKNIDVWADFFEDREVPVIMQDIVCTVISGDGTGLELAQTYQSRLPANQMKIKRESGLMAASKAEYGRFDVLICSAEFGQSYGIGTVADNDNVRVIAKSTGETGDADA